MVLIAEKIEPIAVRPDRLRHRTADVLSARHRRATSISSAPSCAKFFNGTITVLNSDFSTPPVGTQPLVDNLYQGMTLDAVTGLYYERFRNYSPNLGTWVSQAPLSCVNGANTYQFVDSSPVGAVDPSGLAGGNSQCVIPEIASQLRAIRTKLIQKFYGESMAQQQAFINAMSPANPVAAAQIVIGSWEMTHLAAGKRYAVVGKVYHGQDINYWLYGFVFCRYRLFAWAGLHRLIHFDLKMVWGQAG